MRTISRDRQGCIITHAFTTAFHSLLSCIITFLTPQTFLFHSMLFSHQPSIPFVAFLSISHLLHQILYIYLYNIYLNNNNNNNLYIHMPGCNPNKASHSSGIHYSLLPICTLSFCRRVYTGGASQTPHSVSFVAFYKLQEL